MFRLVQLEKFDAKMIPSGRKRRMKQVEDAAPRGQVLRIVEACQPVAVAVERDTATDIDSRRTFARYADGLEDRGQLRVAGDARPSRLQAPRRPLGNPALPPLPQQHVTGKQSADRTAGDHSPALGGERHLVSAEPRLLVKSKRPSHVKPTL